MIEVKSDEQKRLHEKMLASNKAISYQLYIEEEKKEVPKYKKDNFSEVLRNKMDRSR